MASASESVPEVPLAGRLFYCHRCTHQWRKLEDSEFSCPQCQEGFIEDINDTAISAVAINPEEARMDATISEIDRMIQSRIAVTSRARSRSPRNLHSFNSFMRSASELSAMSGSSSSSSGSTAPLRFSDINFDLDDLMSSFLQSPGPSPTTQAQLETLTVFQVTEEHLNTTCSICFDEFELNEEKIRQMPCKHIYHENCIFPWLRINGNCPVCRCRLPGAENNDAPPARDAARYDEILRFMRLRRGSYRRAAGESSTASDVPPQLALRGRGRGTSSASGPSRQQEAAQSSSGRPRRIRGEDRTNDSSDRRTFNDSLLRHFAREVFQDAGSSNFSERRRRAVRLNADEAGHSRSRIPTLLATAATVRARAILTEGRRGSIRRNHSDGEEEQVSDAARPTIRTVLELLPGPPRGGATPEISTRERARLERDRRNERRNRIMEAASFSPDIEQEIASVFSAIRAPAAFIDLTDDLNDDSPLAAPMAASISSESSSSTTTTSSSSDSSSQLASPLSAITSEEEAINFVGAIGRRASSNEE